MRRQTLLTGLKIAIIISFLLFPTNVSFAFFSDIPVNHENYDAITYLENLGVVQGYYDYRAYQPDQPINRAEFVKIITVSKYEKGEIDNCTGKQFFSDVPKNEWFSPYVCIARKYNIINGYPDGTFKPADNISFVEAAKIVALMFGISPQNADIWYKPYVEYLSEQKAIPLSIHALDQKVTRGEMAEMIYRLREKITNKPSNLYDVSADILKTTASQVQYDVPKTVWKIDTNGEISNDPTVSDGTVYLGTSNGYLYALDLGTGEEKWEFKNVSENSYNQQILVSNATETEPIDPAEYYAIEGKATVDKDFVYFGTNLGHVYALDRETGQEKWKFTASFAVKNEAYISDETLIFHDYGKIYALDSSIGKLLWDFEPEYTVQAITISDDKVYVATDKKIFYVLDKNSGKMLWSSEIGTDITSSVVVQGNNLYLGGSDGYIYVLQQDTGAVERKITTKLPNVYGFYYLAVSDDMIYAKRYKYLYALGKTDSQEKWKFQPVGTIYHSPIITDNRIFLRDDAGYLYILDGTTGREEKRYFGGSKKQFAQIVPVDAGDEIISFGVQNESLYLLQ